jgi:hypothetical protein
MGADEGIEGVYINRACPVGVSCVKDAELSALNAVAEAAERLVGQQSDDSHIPDCGCCLCSALAELEKVRGQ